MTSETWTPPTGQYFGPGFKASSYTSGPAKAEPIKEPQADRGWSRAEVIETLTRPGLYRLPDGAWALRDRDGKAAVFEQASKAWSAHWDRVAEVYRLKPEEASPFAFCGLYQAPAWGDGEAVVVWPGRRAFTGERQQLIAATRAAFSYSAVNLEGYGVGRRPRESSVELSPMTGQPAAHVVEEHRGGGVYEAEFAFQEGRCRLDRRSFGDPRAVNVWGSREEGR